MIVAACVEVDLQTRQVFSIIHGRNRLEGRLSDRQSIAIYTLIFVITCVSLVT
jgi:hypothetical protein